MRKKSMPIPIPVIDIRYDVFYHGLRTMKLMKLKEPFHCRHEGCTNRTEVICTKCNVC